MSKIFFVQLAFLRFNPQATLNILKALLSLIVINWHNSLTENKENVAWSMHKILHARIFLRGIGHQNKASKMAGEREACFRFVEGLY